MRLELQLVLFDELSCEVYVGEVFFILEDQQIGIHVFLDDLAVLPREEVGSGEEDHVVLVGRQVGDHLKNAVRKRWVLSYLFVHHLYLLYQVFYFYSCMVGKSR